MRKYSFCIGHYFSRTLVIFEVFLIKQINLIMSAKNTILWEYFTAWKSDDSMVKFNLQNNKALIVLVSKLRLTILYISQEKLPTKISYFQQVRRNEKLTLYDSIVIILLSAMAHRGSRLDLIIFLKYDF